MNYEDLIEGLKQRGFVGIEGICNCGDCNKNDRHYILLTDGLVIYSNIAHYRNEKYVKDSLVESWPLEKFSKNEKEFSFEELDEIMKLPPIEAILDP